MTGAPLELLDEELELDELLDELELLVVPLELLELELEVPVSTPQLAV